MHQSISLHMGIGLFFPSPNVLNQTLQLITVKLERRAQYTILQQQFLHITTPFTIHERLRQNRREHAVPPTE